MIPLKSLGSDGKELCNLYAGEQADTGLHKCKTSGGEPLNTDANASLPVVIKR